MLLAPNKTNAFYKINKITLSDFKIRKKYCFWTLIINKLAFFESINLKFVKRMLTTFLKISKITFPDLKLVSFEASILKYEIICQFVVYKI